jgi:hypothetical protein
VYLQELCDHYEQLGIPTLTKRTQQMMVPMKMRTVSYGLCGNFLLQSRSSFGRVSFSIACISPMESTCYLFCVSLVVGYSYSSCLEWRFWGVSESSECSGNSALTNRRFTTVVILIVLFHFQRLYEKKLDGNFVSMSI